MNIPRHLLPQIPSDKLSEFMEFLRGHGVECSYKQLPIASLKPIQENVNKQKVEALMKNPKARTQPLIVSKGGYILDGHHRWLAEAALKEKQTMKCLFCNCTIKQLFELAHQFDGSFTKSVREVRLMSFVPNRFLF